ncbi:hypothetical protein CBL_08908 [Carabus blaptoides fortunei]
MNYSRVEQGQREPLYLAISTDECLPMDRILLLTARATRDIQIDSKLLLLMYGWVTEDQNQIFLPNEFSSAGKTACSTGKRPSLRLAMANEQKRRNVIERSKIGKQREYTDIAQASTELENKKQDLTMNANGVRSANCVQDRSYR